MERDLYCIVLAAGRSSRMGKQKLLLPVDGRRLLDRALETAASWPTIVVLSPDLATEAPPRDDLTVIVNGEPELGMVHSLRLGNAQVPSEAAIAVLLADTPLVDRALVATVSAARGDADVAYPVRAGTPGHPVIFGPVPRGHMQALPPGDSVRRLRDDPRWRVVRVEIADDRPFTDIDTPEDLRRFSGKASS